MALATGFTTSTIQGIEHLGEDLTFASPRTALMADSAAAESDAADIEEIQKAAFTQEAARVGVETTGPATTHTAQRTV